MLCAMLYSKFPGIFSTAVRFVPSFLPSFTANAPVVEGERLVEVA